MIYILENIGGHFVWEGRKHLQCPGRMVCSGLGTAQSFVGKGIDRPELQWTTSTLVGLSTAQITY